MADARERRHRLGGDRVQQLREVAEPLGQLAPHLEMQLGGLLARDVPVHVLDLVLEARAVHE